MYLGTLRDSWVKPQPIQTKVMLAALETPGLSAAKSCWYKLACTRLRQGVKTCVRRCKPGSEANKLNYETGRIDPASIEANSAR